LTSYTRRHFIEEPREERADVHAFDDSSDGAKHQDSHRDEKGTRSAVVQSPAV
jgi:hypothetical protein